MDALGCGLLGLNFQPCRDMLGSLIQIEYNNDNESTDFGTKNIKH